jgi:hypothetical protein
VTDIADIEFQIQNYELLANHAAKHGFEKVAAGFRQKAETLKETLPMVAQTEIAPPQTGLVLVSKAHNNFGGMIYPVGCKIADIAVVGPNYEALLRSHAIAYAPDSRVNSLIKSYPAPAPESEKPNPEVKIVRGVNAEDSLRKTLAALGSATNKARAVSLLEGIAEGRELIRLVSGIRSERHARENNLHGRRIYQPI